MIRPETEQVKSPNFKKGVPNRKITCVVLHATATAQLNSPLQWLCDEKSGVSAHYLIGLDGRVIQLVDENDVAWHAGESEWNGKAYVNSFSIGIEIVNANDGIMQYPEAQLEACCALVAAICTERNIPIKDVVGHMDIAPKRKTDPAAFPWDDFRGRLKMAGLS